MYKKFIIELSNPDNDIQILEFDIHNNPLAQKWAKEIDNNYNFYEQDRFTYWPNNGKDSDFFSNKINEQIEIINSFYPDRITLRAMPNMDQETMNNMHVFFEQLRGPIEDPLDWYLNSPPEVRKAIERLNLLVHEYEYGELFKKWDTSEEHPNAMIVGTYDERPRYELSLSEYSYFTYRFKFGGVYINYCVVGKPILDVFLNQDEVIGDNNIRPQRHWSADWMIKFGLEIPESKIVKMEESFWDWFSDKEEFFNKLGIFRGPRMALGQIPVADIDMNCDTCKGLTPTEILHKLAPYQYLKSTRVK